MSGQLLGIWMPSWDDLSLFSPELVLIAAIISVLLVSMVAGRGKQLLASVALCGALATLVVTTLVAEQVWEYGQWGFAPPEESGMLIADRFSVFFKFFLMLFLSVVIGLWLIGNGIKEDKPRTDPEPMSSTAEFFVLLLTSALGMVLMVGTLNLLVMVIAIEIASLPSYAIVGSDKSSRRSAEASLKYVTFGAASSAIMVYGISLLYGCYGTLDVPSLAAQMTAGPEPIGALVWMGLLAMSAGIAFKISAVPFHFWCPDVFEGAPIEVTTWLSVASKAAGLGLILRLMHAFGLHAGTSMLPYAIGVGVAASITCTVGNLAALRQDRVKRLLAYSSIAHAGYMLMAAAILVQPSSDPEVAHMAKAAIIAYLFVYLLMNTIAFGVTAFIIWMTGSDHISQFDGLGRRNLWLALPMAVALFSLVGLPPLGGFAAKWLLLVALGEAAMSDASQSWLWALVVVAVVNTAISLYYYVRIIRHMFLVDDPKKTTLPAPMSGVALFNVCAIILLLLGTIFFNALSKQSGQFATRSFVSRTPAPEGARVSAPVETPDVSLQSAQPRVTMNGDAKNLAASHADAASTTP